MLIPHSYSLFFEAKVSIDRIEAFLALPETPHLDNKTATHTSTCTPAGLHPTGQARATPEATSSALAGDGKGAGETSSALAGDGKGAGGVGVAAQPLHFKWDWLLRSEGSSNHMMEEEEEEEETNDATRQQHQQQQHGAGKVEGHKGQGTLSNVRAFGNANLQITPGIHIVVGTVGSGKTTLLLGLLNELQRESAAAATTAAATTAAATNTAAGTGAAALVVSAATTTELGASHPKVNMPASRIGFSAQVPSIINASVRNNVIFGLPYEKSKYLSALHASCLEQDLALMVAGDQTEIGERGVNLSGGQKARVSFARALYSRGHSDLFIFDDPLASVDGIVAERMYNRGVRDYLKGYPRVLVLSSSTHTQAAENATSVITVEAGVAVQRMINPAETIADRMLGTPAAAGLADAANTPMISEIGAAALEAGVSTATDFEGSALDSSSSSSSSSNGAAVGRLVLPEKRSTGAVPMAVYHTYFDHGVPGHGTAVVSGVLGACLLNQLLRVMCDVWVTWWTEVGQTRTLAAAAAAAAELIANATNGSSNGAFVFTASGSNISGIVSSAGSGDGMVVADLETASAASAASLNSTTTLSAVVVAAAADTVASNTMDVPAALAAWSMSTWVIAIILWNVANAVVALVRGHVCATLSVKSSRGLHTAAATSVVAAPLIFFQQNPSGRILNRLSTDLHRADILFPDTL